jgi:hypothetical protein
MHDDPNPTVQVTEYDLLVDRLRHAIQFAEAARKMAQDALELVEAHKSLPRQGHIAFYMPLRRA